MISQWVQRWQVPFEALHELEQMFGITMSEPRSLHEFQSEARTQSLVRIEASRKGLKLWRNNVGVLFNERGVPVRYGLANDSPALNKSIKSGDLIGWRPLLITQELVGTKVAQFVSRECKRRGWSYSGSEHEIAQLRWIHAVVADGGDAKFVTDEGSL